MKLVNNYLQIEPVVNTDFIRSEHETYQETGVVIGTEDGCTIPLGANVFFDSFMAKKYPAKDGKFHWFVHLDEVVAYEDPKIPE